MKKTLFLMLTYCVGLCGNAFAAISLDTPVSSNVSVIGGGIVGAL